ncbi:hypothetical protein OK015_28495 (plasmid) [Mycobacterium sp. Aquia_216]|uniref:hypothetical protein n=1 Tax=Mycobacterium sp. Aquia_216 TaxID=2991729 RepID=UPI00227A6615|nr:hypothetical protein [Mycobacterium sp. Aquia_216]WAJ47989.1 hypothetical protein OK015_28495 [Mycobacterium sp. Aquia_216]
MTGIAPLTYPGLAPAGGVPATLSSARSHPRAIPDPRSNRSPITGEVAPLTTRSTPC